MLPDSRDEGFTLGRILRKVLVVPGMVSASSWGQVGEGPDRECQAGQGPGGDGPAGPFDDLPKIIGTGDPAIEASQWDLIARFTGFPQVL